MNLDFLTGIFAGAIGMGLLLCTIIVIVCVIATGCKQYDDTNPNKEENE